MENRHLSQIAAACGFGLLLVVCLLAYRADDAESEVRLEKVRRVEAELALEERAKQLNGALERLNKAIDPEGSLEPEDAESVDEAPPAA